MRNSMKTLAAAAALIAGVALAPALHAHDSGDADHRDGPMMDRGMMEPGGMMNMMGQMSSMMKTCNEMMQGAMNDGSGAPNEQWREDAPAAPEKNG